MKKADIMISGGTILTMVPGEKPVRNGAIVINGECITEIDTREEIEKEFHAQEVIDASGCIIMPGMINGHTHTAMTCFRGMADDLRLEDWLNNYIFPAEAKHVNCDFVFWGTLLACAEMIRSGTTTFCDMYIFEDEVARAAQSAGMRCLVGEVLFDFPSPNYRTPQEGLEYTEILIEKWRNDPLVDIIVEPHSLYTCSPELLLAAKGLADKRDCPFGIHYLETISELQCLSEKFEKGPTSFLKDHGFLDDRFIGFHCVHMTQSDIEMFARQKSSIIHNPESNMKLASGVAPVPDMISAGIKIGIGTDGCASNNNLDLFQEMDMAAKIHKAHRLDPTVMDAGSVTRMATCSGAEALGLAAKIGSLRPGMKADIIVLDFEKPHLIPLYNEYSHLVYSVKGSDVETVLIHGKIVMKNRRLMTIDENEVMAKVREIAMQIKESFHI